MLDVLRDSDTQIFPLEVLGGPSWSVVYKICDGPCSVLEYATVYHSLLHVENASIAALFDDLGEYKPRIKNSWLSKLLDLFADEWDFTRHSRAEILARQAGNTVKTLGRKRRFVELDGKFQHIWDEILAEPETDEEPLDSSDLARYLELHPEAEVHDGPDFCSQSLQAPVLLPASAILQMMRRFCFRNFWKFRVRILV